MSRYDGTSWQTFTAADGLVSNSVISIFQSLNGAIWFGTNGAGVSRLDETRWETLRFGDVIAGPGNVVRTVYQAQDGALWFGTQSQFANSIGAAIRFDEEVQEIFIAGQGLVNSLTVQSITQARDGAMWFGTDRGVSRYDGTSWQTFTKADGLAVGIDWQHIGFGDAELGYNRDLIKVAFARRLHGRLSVGASLKYLFTNMSLDGQSVGKGSGVGADVGILVSVTDQVRLGVTSPTTHSGRCFHCS